jgi:hypothetical protein
MPANVVKLNSRSRAGLLPSEHDEQATVVDWANHHTGKYPELELLYAIPNGGGRGKPFITKSGEKRPPLLAIRLKEEGLKTGIPDLCLPVARGGYHACYIEMKRQDGTLSDEQRRVQQLLARNGNYVTTCYNASQAILVLTEYLKQDES